MAPKPPPMSLLFHPKKNAKKPGQAPSPKPGTSQSPRKPPAPKKDDDDEELQLPDGPFQEFRLLSSALNGWKYDVMKFESRRPIDVFRWTQPIKLNRKDLRRDDGVANVVPEAVGPMYGPDGKPVVGPDGRTVMVDADGRPIQSSGGGAGSKDKGKVAAKKRFQRKTRQVFFVPEEVRQMRREERYPWVMEDSSEKHDEVWIGQMEDLKKSETHGFFMPAANDVFKFVPAHRWYKFQKKHKYNFPTDTANVEKLWAESQKRDPQTWLANRKGKASAATIAMFKAEAEGRDIAGPSSLVYGGGQSLAPGGRKLKIVDSGMDHLFDNDDDGEGGAARRRKRELGEEGDMDEQVYEDDFADDDEKMEVDDNDEEAKEIEERLKKEYQTANKQREAGVDDSEDDEDANQPQNKQAKAMQKLIRKREGNEDYDSDEEKNPYASSEEEEEEEEPPVVATASAAIQEQQQKVESRAQTPKPAPPGPRPLAVPAPESRAASPVLSPGHGGHSVVAKRAASPKIPKPKAVNISRGNSPLGGQQTLGGSRPTSPALDVPNGTSTLKAGVKRKAEDSPTSPTSHSVNAASNPQSQLPKAKKRKPPPGVTPIVVSSTELESLLVDWLRKTTTATTRDCIHHFTPYLTDQEIKDQFSGMVRKHAILKGGVLVFRSRGGSSAPSPPATTNGA